MSDAEKSKFLHSRIQRSTVSKSASNSVATYATMSSEGRRAVANTPNQIEKIMNSYTYYVSMNTEDKEKTEAIDQATKRQSASFTKGDIKTDEFDNSHEFEISKRVKLIRNDLKEEMKDGGSMTGMNRPFTLKELQKAIKRLKAKLWKACGLDGINNWMVYLAGDDFHNMLLKLYNKCWTEGEYPEDWFQTLISYIYKGKGPLHELTSYRPIGLTSTLVNLMKPMMLARIAPIISEQLHGSQGGYRTGSGAKEQLWALIEMLEEGMESEEPTLFCTTDVHKAFDQVYRDGTIYLLYCHGIRGRMLHMLDKWINNNIAQQLWRGHMAPAVNLDANGLRQGCVLSPILYLLIINALV
jgi:hypothetical protein